MSGKERKNVLVIDDNDIDRACMMELLSSAGFAVHGLPSPIGATRVARELKVDAVIIDQKLPAMEGSKLALLFRGNPSMRSTRLILVSGIEDEDMLALARQAQVDVFVSKRNLHQDLIPSLTRLLRGGLPR